MRSLFAFLALAICCMAGAASDELTSKDIAEIKQICRALDGAEVAPSKSRPILRRLAPYVLDETTLSKWNAVCDTGCRVVIPLRDGAEIDFTYTNIPDKHNRITTVVFRRHDQVYLSIPPAGAR